jgi:hypothetical protein
VNLIKQQRYFIKAKVYERNVAPKSNALTSWPSVTNPISDHYFSVFIKKYPPPPNCTYPVRYFRVPPGLRYPRLKATLAAEQIESQFADLDAVDDYIDFTSVLISC